MSPGVGKIRRAGLTETGMLERQGSLRALQSRFQANRPHGPNPHLHLLPGAISLPYSPPTTCLLQPSGWTSSTHPFTRLMLIVKVTLGLVSNVLQLKRKNTKPRRCDNVLEGVRCPALYDLLVPPGPPCSVPNTNTCLLFDKTTSCFYNLIGRHASGHLLNPEKGSG